MIAPDMFVPRVSFSNVRGDLLGGLTAAVVALPLALAFGVASGAGAIAGVWGAIFVGLFASLFGGTPAQVSGPTGPMTVVMAAVLARLGHEPALAFTVVVLAGLFQIGFGIARLGRFVNLMPYPVISGFMTGIGCIIIVLQLGPLLGTTDPQGEPLAALGSLPGAVRDANPHALAAGLLALAVAFAMPARLARWLPASLAALAIGTAAVLAGLDRAPVLGEIPSGLPEAHLPRFELSSLPLVLKSALVLAVLGAIDSLLTSLIADNITRTRHDSDRELVGQGIGNLVAGLFGAIPGAGATMRTVVNVRAGGRTPLSGAFHAVVLAAVMLGLAPLAAHIPHAVLAAILIKTGVDIVDWDYLRRAPHAPRAGVAMMAITVALTVLTDLVTAVSAGVVMASLLFVKRMAELQIASVRAIIDAGDPALSPGERELLTAARGAVTVVHLSGPMSFGAANELGRRVLDTGEQRVVVLDLTEVPFVDSSASLAIEGVIAHAVSQERTVLLAGLTDPVRRTLTRVGVLRRLGPGRRFSTRAAALRRALELVEAPDGAGG